jgi:hypothetical protein
MLKPRQTARAAKMLLSAVAMGLSYERKASLMDSSPGIICQSHI